MNDVSMWRSGGIFHTEGGEAPSARTSLHMPCINRCINCPMAMPLNGFGTHATLGLMGTCERARAADSLARCALATHCLSSAISSSMLR